VLVPVTLYTAVKSNPVTGEIVRNPGGPTIRTWIVSGLSVEGHNEPVFRTPPMHFNTIEPPKSRFPETLASAGLMIVWFALSVISNPLIASAPWTNTTRLSCVPTVALTVTGEAGHAVAEAGAKQTNPTGWPLTLANIEEERPITRIVRIDTAKNSSLFLEMPISNVQLGPIVIRNHHEKVSSTIISSIRVGNRASCNARWLERYRILV